MMMLDPNGPYLLPTLHPPLSLLTGNIEQQIDGLTGYPVLTKHLLFLVEGGGEQTAINWEHATNSYGSKVGKYLIIACASKCLLTRFA